LSSSNSKQVRENIDIHLDFTYPLDGKKDGRAYRWIFNVSSSSDNASILITFPLQSEKCPEDIKPFAWRYLHERNLYTARKSNLADVILFARNLKRHLNIMCSDAENAVIQRRCERLISNNARMWNVERGFGFLVERDGVLRKTAQFEAAWRDRRSKWINSAHNGNTTGVIELERSPSIEAAGGEAGASRKRVRLHPQRL
jgi:hypothetical protein